jgi:diacylglycerol kinase (ATP)
MGKVVDDSGRTEYFTNAIGIGFDAFVTYYSYKITRLQGFSMYLWAVIQTIIRNHDAPSMHITADEATFRQDILMLTLCNGRREGGGFLVAPEAKPDDGLLDYVIIRKVSRPMMFRLIPEVMKGTHGRFKAVQLGRFRHLEVRSERPMTIHADGEMLAGFPSTVQALTIDVLPGALKVIT